MGRRKLSSPVREGNIVFGLEPNRRSLDSAAKAAPLGMTNIKGLRFGTPEGVPLQGDAI